MNMLSLTHDGIESAFLFLQQNAVEKRAPNLRTVDLLASVARKIHNSHKIHNPHKDTCSNSLLF